MNHYNVMNIPGYPDIIPIHIPFRSLCFSHVTITLMVFFCATEPMVNMVNGSCEYMVFTCFYHNFMLILLIYG